MPDDRGILSDDEIAKLNEKFEGYERELGRDLVCEICGGIVWTLNNQVIAIPGDTMGTLLSSVTKVPLLNYYCPRCGNMKFFSAGMWGVHLQPKASVKGETSGD